MAWPVTKVVIAQKDTSNPDLTIKVTGYQWKWGYDYLKGEGAGISFCRRCPRRARRSRAASPRASTTCSKSTTRWWCRSDKKVRMLITAADVIHCLVACRRSASSRMPSPASSATPGSSADKIGTYRGQCAELCGKDHGFMPIVVRGGLGRGLHEVGRRAAEEAGRQPPTTRTRPGRSTSSRPAARRSTPPTASPATRRTARACRRVPRARRLEDRHWGRRPAQIDTGAERPAEARRWRPSKQLSDVELAAVITYTRNSWGNKTGEAMQPAEIKAPARK